MIFDDLYRLNSKSSVRELVKAFLIVRPFRPIVTLRLCQVTSNRGNFFFRLCHLFFRSLHRLVCGLACIDFPWETSVSSGLALTHGWGIVIAPGVRIGRNVTLFHGVTLGRRDSIGLDGARTIGYPTIEDDVWIGPNAIIVGDVVIGKGSRIAGGAFVLSSVPPHTVVMGNPAKIVKTGSLPDVPNRLPD